jgi:pimeloyl-ACP methyl ester carboxylesterase
VAARLHANNPRLPAERADWLATRWARQGDDGRWHILADPDHKRVYPVLYRREEAMACWARISAPLLWAEGAATDMTRWWGSRYPREDFEARLATVAQVQRVVIADAGHMLHHDQPAAVAAALAAFLR